MHVEFRENRRDVMFHRAMADRELGGVPVAGAFLVVVDFTNQE
jgi:hypothetical protein